MKEYCNSVMVENGNSKSITGNKADLCWHIPMLGREKPRRFWDPGRQLLRVIRAYQVIDKSRNPLKQMLKKWFVLKFRFWSVVTGADIPLNTGNIGGGLLIPHPNGIVVHPDVIIGANCLIFQQVTITGGVRLGYHVDIGAGAKIIGPVTIGNNVFIGANAVITKNIASGITVVGIPAVPI